MAPDFFSGHLPGDLPLPAGNSCFTSTRRSHEADFRLLHKNCAQPGCSLCGQFVNNYSSRTCARDRSSKIPYRALNHRHAKSLAMQG